MGLQQLTNNPKQWYKAGIVPRAVRDVFWSLEVGWGLSYMNLKAENVAQVFPLPHCCKLWFADSPSLPCVGLATLHVSS